MRKSALVTLERAPLGSVPEEATVLGVGIEVLPLEEKEEEEEGASERRRLRGRAVECDDA